MTGYCDRCKNTGEIDCYCGGDLCVCGRDVLPCPSCDGGRMIDTPEPDDFDTCPTCKGEGRVNPLTPGLPEDFFCVGATDCPACNGTGTI